VRQLAAAFPALRDQLAGRRNLAIDIAKGFASDLAPKKRRQAATLQTD
jgi:hypothetical protein